MNNELIEIGQVNSVTSQSNDVVADLNELLRGRYDVIDRLKFQFVSSHLSLRQRLDSLIHLKSAMIVPALNQAFGFNVDTASAVGSERVLEVLDSIEKTLLSLIKIDDTEVVNFTNPRITASYKMLFELIVDILREEVKDSIVINNIINKVAVRCVGLEQEFNRTFKSVAVKLLDSIDNPLTTDFNNRDTNVSILAERAIDCLSKLKAQSVDIPNLDSVLASLDKLKDESNETI